ncbi:MAG: bifunctional demethylmenaquinone methyltransferase/2-methoxy-6-polyprenyl-1,4-benzoquinol methylase UbiE [Phycisphaerales bacterium]|nr:bifunctional demethylmenaquinone methyltransferase/2-methoxy-6-polyprenyl-1,4-benzoquinol methylase UbiE [Phycisphaerales bacterium]
MASSYENPSSTTPTGDATTPVATDPSLSWDSASLRGNPHDRDDKAMRVREMFTAIAHAYDLNNRVHSLGLDQSWRRKAVQLAEPVVGAEVLDVACGTGDLSQSFALAGAKRVIGLDYTPAMLDQARMKAARKGGACGRIEYVQGDAQELPYSSRCMDIVSIAFGIRNVADPLRAIHEFHRVLRPGGRLVVLEFAEPQHPVIRFMHRIYTHHIMPWTATILARDGSGAYRYLPRSVQTFLDPSALATQLKSAGFSKVSQHPLTMGTCVVTVGEVST